jgi:SAM-dependent methyltransferase
MRGGVVTARTRQRIATLIVNNRETRDQGKTDMKIKAPQPLKGHARALRYGFRVARALFGKFPRECTVCGYKGYFYAYGNPLSLGINVDALCPRCLSLERHRLMALCDREKQLFTSKGVLHFAPERGLKAYVQSRQPRKYVTCDLLDPAADLKINIESMNMADHCFDLIICSHVLEHVNDHLAIPELWRITRPGGMVIAMVPLVEGWNVSFEDSTKTANEADRILYFNQRDHVRMFGRDFRDRLTAPGFQLEEFTAVEPYVSRHGLLRGEKVFLAKKPVDRS